MASLVHKLTKNRATFSIAEETRMKKLLGAFPNFPFGYCLDPVSTTWVENLGVRETEEVASDDDARTIWADSVKK
ncbi:hypothetical protein FEM48_Zijuj05G0060100 [Ziziphus jujuba var. spinosa]|uniref:Uncharacterized protein n=1 Tax=Ziziphus jujuba var. spinosa TaxID=714518 RepID=A0A978VD80_ZIZJJ|nr:hypothetical protein FEM48_Zijuj05G0060100 [Ziziphus jujuba var. spinosa]